MRMRAGQTFYLRLYVPTLYLFSYNLGSRITSMYHHTDLSFFET